MRTRREMRRIGALVLCAVLAMALAIGFAAGAQAGVSHGAVTAKSGCQPYSQGGPCLGPIQTAYNYEGEGEQAVKLMWAKFGAKKVVGSVFEPDPPGQYEITQRHITWHSVASVEIVAVYEVKFMGRRARYRKLPSQSHSGHAVLRDIRGQDAPILLLQGRRV